MTKMSDAGRRSRAARVSLLAAAGAIALTCAPFAASASAMGLPQNGGMDLLLPNTVTVEGAAAQVVSNPVSDVSYSVNVQDTSFQAVNRDWAVMEAHIRKGLHRLGIPSGDILTTTPSSYNSNQNSGPSASEQVNVVVTKPGQVPAVLNALSAFSPNYVQNSYSNVQILSLNPAALWKPLFHAAMGNARAQAEALAAEANKNLGGIVSISTVPAQGYMQSVSGPYPTSPTVAGMQMNGYGNQVAPEVSTQIFVTFALVPKSAS
ncbi:MAG: SIMPL domain-containing protein [Bacilli bacterium]